MELQSIAKTYPSEKQDAIYSAEKKPGMRFAISFLKFCKKETGQW